ncbi:MULTISPECIES: DUF5979 domain-containing protein [unclassified Leucobacter]|uniref:DUF5979 domain-containing protein n=1 Tax=unclassified Leucobacter TaxID=2621730 RepID=UPI00165DFD43|nr:MULTISPECIES: DUF5979 domain-containing protein [unclassified Leucobacter]MBC9937682.1 LPXTG cell wall anchor domain-containing protein [Leucobacter sp. cx-87]
MNHIWGISVAFSNQAFSRRGRLRSWISGALVVLLVGATFGASGLTPAAAQPGSFLQIDKKVNGQDAHRELQPGQSVNYRVEFSAENYDADGPVLLTDVLPAAFAGWAISGIGAKLPGQPDSVLTLEVPGVSPAGEGVVGSSEADRTITLDIAAPIDGGGTGLPTGAQGWIEYTLTVPADLTVDWAFNDQDLVNQATISGFGADPADPLSAKDDAVISVHVPLKIDVTPNKTWEPGSQAFEPGAASTITIGATQSSNVAVDSLVLQDTPTAQDGATELEESNPFRYVDFTGFAGDPAAPANWPAGAASARVEVYAFDGTSWNWTEYGSSIANADVGGVRLSYAGAIEPDATVTQAFGAAQREEDRLGLTADLSKGYSETNTVSATVETAGQPAVTKDATAPFAVTPTVIEVRAGKTFVDAGGAEVEPLKTVAGNTVHAILTAKNQDAPNSATLDALTIREPAAGSDAAYFSEELAFAGFDPSYSAQVWPAGATGGTITWQSATGPETVVLVPGAALPSPPAGLDISGFEITFTGAIAPSATSQVKYAIDTSEDLALDGAEAGPFLNKIEVEGTRPNIDEPATDGAEANLVVVSPAINVAIEKKLSPSTVFPGDDVIVQLPANATAVGDKTKPVEIVVADQLPAGAAGTGTFWDAYNLTEVVAPIDVPAGATLTIERFDSDTGSWVAVTTLTDRSDVSIDLSGVAATTTGIRFNYTNPAGLGVSTDVKPNLRFEARSELRSGGTTTPNGAPDFTPTPYLNTATVDATGKLENRAVAGDASDTETGSIRDDEAMGVGPMWADKNWTDDLLVSQSGTSSSTVQQWVLSEPGFAEITLTDPALPSVSGVGTVYEAFNLTRVQPITFSSSPQLKWDLVSRVELWNGSVWSAPTGAPADGNWMNAQGFVGYTLSGAEQLSTLGVRLTLASNEPARAAAAAAGDVGAPAVGAGVSASAEVRSYQLDWQLRDQARSAAPTDPVKWVTSETTFNCLVPPALAPDAGCIDNTFEIAGERGGTTHRGTASDTINVIDGVANVSLQKEVAPAALTVPKGGDLLPEDYPTTRFTLTTENVSGLPTQGEKGAMKLGKLRVTDVATDILGATGMELSPFADRDFASEAGQNHFDQFTLTGVSFSALPAYIDVAQSQVELWIFENGVQRSEVFSIAQLQGTAPGGPLPELLANTVGVAVTYQGTSPEIYGNRIVAGDDLTMQLDMQLRPTHRATGAPVLGGPDGSAVQVSNFARALGQDLVVDPSREPADTDDAVVGLTSAKIAVRLEKSVSVENTLPGTHADTKNLYEADPQAPVTVGLTATPNGSTAPLDSLVIEDSTAGFWEIFELVSLGTPVAPIDADRRAHEALVDGNWIAFEAVTDLAQVRGLRVTFDRVDGALFPLRATSWTSSWGTATLPFTVQLRAGLDSDWTAGIVTNTASTTATGSGTGTATDDAEQSIGFVPGTNAISVQKRAPLDSTTHIVSSMESAPWQLIFKNTGSSYLPIETVTDQLPATLKWDGVQPTFSQTGGADLSIDPAQIGVGLDGGALTFTWPADSFMAPGEEVTIDLGVILQPGLNASEKASNEVIVETGVVLATCTQPTNNGQVGTTPGSSSECTNTNYVHPRGGTLVGAVKTVNGERVDTLGENLIGEMDGLDIKSGADCAASRWSADGYVATPCAAYTAVGATDSWKLQHVNAGTADLARMTIVDMLPRTGDKLLAGNAQRASTFRPVLADPSSIALAEMPAGATYTVELTTNPTNCIGQDPVSAWIADPECSGAGNTWIDRDSYTGAVEDIAGFRVIVTMATGAPLKPAEWVNVEFETVNRVIEHTADGLQPTLAEFAEAQFAWNQNGVIAWDTTGGRVNLPKAPPPAGVTLKTGALQITKQVEANGVTPIPEAFPVTLACTVPSGVADPERVALDMGAFAELMVPADGTPVRVEGLPIGADCVVSEDGTVGEHGEVGRSIATTPGVNPADDGMSAEITIRSPRSGAEATLVNLTNTYSLGELIVEKSSRSSNEFPLSGEQLRQSFDFALVCQWGGTKNELTREFTLQAGAQQVISDLPTGARCELTETGAGGAASTNITVAGQSTAGVTLEGLVLSEDGAHVLFTNSFAGVPPKGLPGTGSNSAAALIAAALALLAIGGAAVVFARRRRESPLN